MKRWLSFLFCLLPMIACADDYVIISGGPALQYFERHKETPHDRYWGNFIDAATAQIKKLKPTLQPNDKVTWLVYRPAYETRGKEENQNLISTITQQAQALNVTLVWFNSRQELLDNLNSHSSENRIAHLDYFGHSNKRNWMFDYSNQLDGASMEPSMLHIWHLHLLHRDIFTDEATAQSWGCHSGEEYSGAWYKRLGKRMKGAVGKTDYSKGGLPIISTPSGKWTQ